MMCASVPVTAVANSDVLIDLTSKIEMRAEAQSIRAHDDAVDVINYTREQLAARMRTAGIKRMHLGAFVAHLEPRYDLVCACHLEMTARCPDLVAGEYVVVGRRLVGDHVVVSRDDARAPRRGGHAA